MNTPGVASGASSHDPWWKRLTKRLCHSQTINRTVQINRQGKPKFLLTSTFCPAIGVRSQSPWPTCIATTAGRGQTSFVGQSPVSRVNLSIRRNIGPASGRHRKSAEFGRCQVLQISVLAPESTVDFRWKSPLRFEIGKHQAPRGHAACSPPLMAGPGNRIPSGGPLRRIDIPERLLASPFDAD